MRAIEAGPDEIRQREERLSAVYTYFGVDKRAPEAAAKLIPLLAAEIFPAAFSVVAKGTPRTKKPLWTWARKNEFLEFMWNKLYSGSSLEEAASEYRQLYCPERSSVKGLIAEFYRADKWQRLGHLTDQESREAFEYAQDYITSMRDEMARGK